MHVTTKFPHAARRCLGCIALTVVGLLAFPGQLTSQTIAEVKGASAWVPIMDESVPLVSTPNEIVTLKRAELWVPPSSAGQFGLLRLHEPNRGSAAIVPLPGSRSGEPAYRSDPEGTVVELRPRSFVLDGDITVFDTQYRQLMWSRSTVRVSAKDLTEWTDECERRLSYYPRSREQYYEKYIDLLSALGQAAAGFNARAFDFGYITDINLLPKGVAITMSLQALRCTGEVIFDYQLNPWMARIGETNRPVFAMDVRPMGRGVDYHPWRGTVEVTIAQADRALHGWTYYRNDETTALGHTGIQETLKAVWLVGGRSWLGPNDAPLIATEDAILGFFVDADTVLKVIESTAKFPCTYENRGRFEEWLEGNVAGTGDTLVKLRPLLDLASIEGWPKGKQGSNFRVTHEDGMLVAEIGGDRFGVSGRFKFNERLELQEKEVFFRPFTPLVEDPDFPLMEHP
jgi:hypothetical protein